MVLSYIFVILLYISCIPIVSHSDDGHRGEENLMVKNYRLNIFINMHLLVCQAIKQDSLMNGYANRKVKWSFTMCSAVHSLYYSPLRIEVYLY